MDPHARKLKPKRSPKTSKVIRRRRNDVVRALLLTEHDSSELRQLLEQCGPQPHEVIVARSAEQARQLLGGGRIDVVVVDIGERDGAGWTALRALRDMAPQTGFVALTNSSDEDIALRAARFGAEEHLPKSSLNVALAERALRYARERRRHLTEQLQVDAKLMRAQRMDAIGQLAAKLAHDVNNMLMVIHMHGCFVDEALDPSGPAKEDMAQVIEATRRASQMAKQLLDIARQQPREARTLDLNQLVLDLKPMLRRLAPTEVGLRVKLAPEPKQVRIVPEQLEQLLVNLALNACDAMPDGGMLDIATSSTIIYADLDATPYGRLAADTYAVLTVSDSGVGMTDAVCERIFEPFFTTKLASDGSGLGLATCRAFVEEAGGHIHVKSAVGKGSSFSIYLPLSQ